MLTTVPITRSVLGEAAMLDLWTCRPELFFVALDHPLFRAPFLSWFDRNVPELSPDDDRFSVQRKPLSGGASSAAQSFAAAGTQPLSHESRAAAELSPSSPYAIAASYAAAAATDRFMDGEAPMALRCGKSDAPLRPRWDTRPVFSVGSEAYYGDGARVVDDATAVEKEAEQLKRYQASVRRAASSSRIMTAILDIEDAALRQRLLALPFVQAVALHEQQRFDVWLLARFKHYDRSKRQGAIEFLEYLDAITYHARRTNADLGGLTLRLANLRSDNGAGPDPMLSWLQFSRPMDRVSDWLKITPTASTNGFTWKECYDFATESGGRLLTVEEAKVVAARLGTSPYHGEDQCKFCEKHFLTSIYACIMLRFKLFDASCAPLRHSDKFYSLHLYFRSYTR
jgi:hypothetical protein